MKKIILVLALIFVASLLPKKAFAQDVARPSASLVSNLTCKADALNDKRVAALRNVFARHNSPLVEYAGLYVKYADENGVDWRLLPAISGLESSFGIYLIQGTHNGYGWGGGTIYFDSWEDGIATIDKALRQNYIDRGATDVWSIGPIYAESPTWSVRVNSFMNEIDEEYKTLSTFAAVPNI